MSESEEQEEPQTMSETEEQEEPQTTGVSAAQGESMKELVEYIAKSIVDEPDEVKVEEETDE